MTYITRVGLTSYGKHEGLTIVLVDTEEGFRMMAHGAISLKFGDTLAARFVTFTGRLIPYFENSI
jgi:hypothetical protein